MLVKFSPRTLLRGSLMLTVWSCEADRELLIDRSPAGRKEDVMDELTSFIFVILI